VNVATLWDCDLMCGKFTVIAINSSKNDTNIGKVAFSHNNTFYVKKFYCNIFQLMYKEPSSG